MSSTVYMADRQPAPHGAPGVSDDRFARLTRGINLSHWFSQARSYDADHLRSHVTRADLQQIKALGFRHVRFALDPAILADARTPDVPSRELLAAVDRALDLILDHDLAAIVDIHPTDTWKRQLGTSSAAVFNFVNFWHDLARHLAPRDPEKVFLEALNEPLVRDGWRWASLQGQLLEAMRAGAPRHTLIATAHRWSGLPELLELYPVADPNVVYNFHCYDPHDFTHQGATWGERHWAAMAELPYPSSPALVAPLLDGIADAAAREAARQYGAARWNAERIDCWVGSAARWGLEHGMRLTCNEFGVYRARTRPEHRAAWIRDVRRALERHNIGWTMWDYAGGFGVTVDGQGSRLVDPETVAALGLSGE